MLKKLEQLDNEYIKYLAKFNLEPEIKNDTLYDIINHTDTKSLIAINKTIKKLQQLTIPWKCRHIKHPTLYKNYEWENNLRYTEVYNINRCISYLYECKANLRNDYLKTNSNVRMTDMYTDAFTPKALSNIKMSHSSGGIHGRKI